jgi:transcriptional regulator with XRE-family HTH domain
MAFGELLQRLRGNRLQKDVAADLGMPVTTLSSLENQDAVPRGPVLKRLADYYGVPVSYFYPTPASAMKSHDGAKEWLRSFHQRSEVLKDTIATHAPPDYPDSVKRQFAEKIRQKKHAETTGRE